MVRFYVAALLVLSAVSVQAQPGLPTLPIQPSPDSPDQRQRLRNFTTCLAEARPRWARGTLSHPYLSDAQAGAAAEALRGTDTCLRGGESEITFRTSGVVGSLAEHFLRGEMNRADFARIAATLRTLAPLNASEDFALCVAARDPAAARDLALSELGSTTEVQAAGQLAVGLEACRYPNEQQPVDLQSLRALISTALYRGVTTVLAARN